jgi:predicted  nucleic acid-binding Zn-ribbon protein
MNPYLNDIIEISQIDNEIAEFEPKVERIKYSYNSIQRQRDEILQEIEKVVDDIRDVDNKIGVLEKDIERIGQEQKEYEKKLNTITKTKELNALTMENNLRKEQIQYDNSEVDRYGKIRDNLDQKLKDKKNEYEEFKEKLSSEEERVKKSLDSISEAKNVVLKDRDKKRDSMNPKIYSFYSKIRKWAGENAVVPVRDGACYGCFIKLNDQTFLEVIKGEEIITCPNCGRVIYLERDEE